MQGFIAGIVLSCFVVLAVFSLAEQRKDEGYSMDDRKAFNALVASLEGSKQVMTKEEQAAAIVYLYDTE